MRDAAPHRCLGLLLIVTACSAQQDPCRCGPSSATFEAPPPVPPPQPPATTLGAPFTLLDGGVSSVNESVQGSFTVREAELGSSVALRAGKPDEVCVAGHLDLVPDDAWDTYWGAEVSMTFDAPPGEESQLWQPDGVIGLAFDLEGTLPPEVRTVATVRDRDLPFEAYCQDLSPQNGDTQYVLFDQLKTDCMQPRGGKPLPQGPLLRFGWYVPAQYNAVDFDFCLSALRPIRAASE